MDGVNDETNKLLRSVRDGPSGGDPDNDDEDRGDGVMTPNKPNGVGHLFKKTYGLRYRWEG